MICELYIFAAGNVAALGPHGRLPLEEGELVDLYLRELLCRQAIGLETILHCHDGPERATLRRYLAERLRAGGNAGWWQRKALARR